MKIKKDIQFKEQQEQVFQKIINSLNLDDNNSFILYEIDNNKDIQDNIMNLIPEIKKYFLINGINGVKEPEKCQRPWLSIIRCLLKKKYNILATDYVVKLDTGKDYHSRRYYILDK